MPIPKIIKINSSESPSSRNDNSRPSAGTQLMLSRSTSPAKTSAAELMTSIKAIAGITSVKAVVWLRVNLPVKDEIILPKKDSKGIQSKVI